MVELRSAEPLRYYILGEIGVGRDLDFSLDRYKAVYDDELANSYGNYVNRTITLWMKLVDPTTEPFDIDLSDVLDTYVTAFDRYDTREALDQCRILLDRANGYLNEQEPWKITDISQKSRVLQHSLEYLYHITTLLVPFLPTATDKVFIALGVHPEEVRYDPDYRYTTSADLSQITKPDILFPKYDD